MADSDSGSVGRAAHAGKARQPDGNVAKLREQVEPSTCQALAIVPARLTGELASLMQEAKYQVSRGATGQPRACFLARCRLSHPHFGNFADQN